MIFPSCHVLWQLWIRSSLTALPLMLHPVPTESPIECGKPNNNHPQITMKMGGPSSPNGRPPEFPTTSAKVRHPLRAARTWPGRKAPDALHVAPEPAKTWFLMVKPKKCWVYVVWDGRFQTVLHRREICFRLGFEAASFGEQARVFSLLDPFVAFLDCWLLPITISATFRVSRQISSVRNVTLLPFFWTRTTFCTPVPVVSALDVISSPHMLKKWEVAKHLWMWITLYIYIKYIVYIGNQPVIWHSGIVAPLLSIFFQ